MSGEISMFALLQSFQAAEIAKRFNSAEDHASVPRPELSLPGTSYAMPGNFDVSQRCSGSPTAQSGVSSGGQLRGRAVSVTHEGVIAPAMAVAADQLFPKQGYGQGGGPSLGLSLSQSLNLLAPPRAVAGLMEALAGLKPSFAQPALAIDAVQGTTSAAQNGANSSTTNGARDLHLVSVATHSTTSLPVSEPGLARNTGSGTGATRNTSLSQPTSAHDALSGMRTLGHTQPGRAVGSNGGGTMSGAATVPVLSLGKVSTANPSLRISGTLSTSGQAPLGDSVMTPSPALVKALGSNLPYALSSTSQQGSPLGEIAPEKLMNTNACAYVVAEPQGQACRGRTQIGTLLAASGVSAPPASAPSAANTAQVAPETLVQTVSTAPASITTAGAERAQTTILSLSLPESTPLVLRAAVQMLGFTDVFGQPQAAFSFEARSTAAAVILNAAMTPGWPFPSSIVRDGPKYETAVLNALGSQIAKMTPEEMAEYLAKIGADFRLLRRLQKTLKDFNGIEAETVIGFLSMLCSALKKIKEALQVQLVLTPEEVDMVAEAQFGVVSNSPGRGRRRLKI